MNNRKIDAAYFSANPLPNPDEGSDKHSRGQVLIIAGSVEVPGAALLAGLGALRSGAGVLQMATCKSNAAHLGMAMPEAMIVGCRETSSGEIDPSNSTRLVDLANNADAVLLGPGLVDEAPVAELRSELLSRVTKPIFVLDASAFTSLRTSRGVAPTHRRRMIVTPHSGEMAKFLQTDKEEIEADPLAAARSAAGMLDAVVAMKGGCTHVVRLRRTHCASNMGPPPWEHPGRETFWQASWLALLPGEPKRSWRRPGPSTCTAMPAAAGWSIMGGWACSRAR